MVEKLWRKVSQLVFNCKEDAETACKQFNQRWQYHQASTEVVPITKHAHLGHPSARAKPNVVGYALAGSVKEFTPVWRMQSKVWVSLSWQPMRWIA